MSFRSLRGVAFAAGLTAFISGCSGGGGNSPAPQPSPTATGSGAPLLDQSVTFTVNVPAAFTLARQRAAFRQRALTPAALPSPSSGIYISPSIGSITVGLVEVNGVVLKSPPAPAGPVNAPAGCASAGCTFTIPSVVAAVGTNYYAVRTFAGPNATGKPLSSALIFVSVNGSGAIDKTLGDPSQLSTGGYVYGLNVVAAPASFSIGAESSVSILVTATDATGATLVGDVQYFSPVTLTARGAGVTLAGPGLTSAGTVVLDGPQPAAPPLFAVYDGTAARSSASVTAATTDGNGNAVQSSVAIGFAAPTPSPTPTAAPTTGPTATPSPGHTPASGPPDSVYVINAGTNAITEYAAPAAGVNPAPRRMLGGATITCAGVVNAATVSSGVLGISVDTTAGNVTVASGGLDACGGQNFTYNRFGPASLSATSPATVIGSEQPFFLVQLEADPASSTAVYESDDVGSSGNAIQHLDQSGAVPGGTAVAGMLNPEFGQQINVGGNPGNNCIASIGRPLSPTLGCSDPNRFDYLDFLNGGPVSLAEPFAKLNDGTIVAAAYDEAELASSSYAALVFLPPLPLPSVNAPDVAGPVWIESPTTLTSAPISLAYDSKTNLIYAMFDDAQGPGNCAPLGVLTLACADNVSHVYIEAFDYGKVKALAAGGRTGGVDLAPAFTLGGVVPGKFGLPAYSPYLATALLPNMMAAADGRLYIANIFPNGYCDAACQNPSSSVAYPYSGQVDVYDVSSLTGYHVGDTAPIATISNIGGSNDGLSVPVGVAVGRTGSVVSTARFRPNPARRALTPRERALLLRERALWLSRRGVHK